jgi:TolB protein
MTSPVTTVAEKENRIAFISRHDNQVGLYVMNADGSNIIRLHSAPGRLSGFSWSPDGTRIVFAAGPDDYKTHIYTIDANGRNLVQLTDNEGAYRNPSWSPDGERIAFTFFYTYPPYYVAGNWEIYVMDADGSNVARLTNFGPSDYPVKWSPDGSRIAFMDWNQYFDIFVVDADSGDLVWRTTTQWTFPETPNPLWTGLWTMEPSWSPDGKQIVFTSSRDDRISRIYIVSADGNDPTRLTQNTEGCWHPAWSPSGNRIAFSCSGLHNRGTYVIDRNGNNRLKLTDIASDIPPAWSPDGIRIAFTATYEEKDGIYTINVDGSNLLRLTDYKYDSSPAWSP